MLSTRRVGLKDSGDTLVLCYHAVSRSWRVGLAVSPDALDRQLSWLLERGYTATTFVDAVTRPAHGKTLAVTFDDAFRSVFAEGFPVLARLDVPATVFAWPTYVDAREAGEERPPGGPAMQAWFGTPHHDELHSMSWDELRTVLAADWEVGSHTVNHPYLTQLDDDALKWELEASRERLEHELGRPCRTLAYPSGDFDDRVVRAAGRAGYAAACTLPARFPSHPDVLAWPRVSIQRNDSFSTFRLKVSPATRRLRQTIIWSGLESARRSAGRVRRAAR
jgi:peptidoglycan/xylan/chitin deacetylase (PgdA/CDA1 family)